MFAGMCPLVSGEHNRRSYRIFGIVATCDTAGVMPAMFVFLLLLVRVFTVC